MLTIRKLSIWQLCIVAIFLLDISFFYLIELPDSFTTYNSLYSKSLIAAFSFILAFLCFFQNQEYFSQFKFVKNYSVFVLLLCFGLILHGFIVYPDQDFLSYLRGCDYLLIVLLTFPLLYVMRYEDEYLHTMYIMNTICFVWYIILILQSINYTTSGGVFIHYFYESENIRTRNDLIRISVASLGNIMVFYNLYILLSKQYSRKLFSLIQFVLGSYCIIFVQQTRAQIFAYVIVITVAILISSKNPMSTIRNYAIVIIAFIALYSSGLISNFINSFTASENIKSTLIRQEAILYYLSFWSDHFLLGMGVSNSELITRGSSGSYYMSDVGFVGIIAKCGIFAFALYGALLIRWIYIIVKMRKMSEIAKEDCVLLCSLLLFIFTPIYSVSYFQPAFAVTMPITIAIFEYVYYKNCLLLSDEE